MSFSKAQDLLRLALLASARRGGISLEEIRAEFGVSHRTAQRMTDALETTVSNVATEDGPDRRRHWKLRDPRLSRLHPRQETSVEALDIAARAARDDGRRRHARALEDLREDLIARLAPLDGRRAEADAEAVLSALGHVARPGPKVVMRADVTDAMIEALRGPFRVRLVYGTPDASPRIIEP